MTNRVLRSVYDTVAAKVIKHYIQGCSSCHRLAAPNKFEVPGYQVQPNDVFSHWSIDCIGPFPADPRTGDLHVIIGVDWLSRWAEAHAVNSIDTAACSEFIYTDIVSRILYVVYSIYRRKRKNS